MARRKTNEEFLREVKELRGDEYTFLEPYKNSKTKIRVRHNECGHVYSVAPSDFLQGKGCRLCGLTSAFKKQRKTNRDFSREVKALTGDEYTFIDEYNGAQTKIKVKHNKCGHIYEVKPTNFLNGKRCPKCSAKIAGDKQRKSEVKFISEVREIHGDEYEVIGIYQSWNYKIDVIHKKCGAVFKISPHHLINGKGCRKCAFERIARLNTKTHSTFLEEVSAQVGEEYSVLGQYSNSKQKIGVRHNLCGYTYSVLPGDFLKGGRCPRCSVSKGEDRITRCFDAVQVKYKYQVKFDDCTGDHACLRFDFGVFSDDGNLSFLVEYDGQQHFEPIEVFGGQKEFEKRKRYDEIKTAYCAERGIPLVRIPYWKYDEIENILEKAIREYRAKPAGKPRERVETRWSSLTRKEWQNTHERLAP